MGSVNNPWDKYLTARDLEVYAAAGYGARGAPGKRPGIIVIDANYNFLGKTPKPILESIKEVRTSCGEIGWQAVPVIQKLVEKGREVGVPIYYSTATPRLTAGDIGGWARKNARALSEDPKSDDGNAFPPEIAPLPGELVVRKEKPSPFHGTPLISRMIADQIDTLIVTGATTSGCVRAGVIDAFSYNLRVMVVADGCFDRGEVSHAINLFDMNQKYADVVHSDEALAYLDSLRKET